MTALLLLLLGFAALPIGSFQLNNAARHAIREAIGLKQAPPAGNPRPQKSKPEAEAETTKHGKTRVTGCISKKDGEYELLTAQGKAIQLTGTKRSLEDHVGKQVQVSGTLESGATAEAGQKKRKLDVTDVKTLSDTCEFEGPPPPTPHPTPKHRLQ